ncbi:hypothetical protein ACVIHI_003006 [Bradyrhizobium sp. USDA 4524]|nr:hypothetical protein [Bradyrhizobium sp. USDA 4538]MCP1904641.1 hypothetical protein [Bradyrhizobium sp. USDA 4537]MCP1915455.1 hypothetical protein [Bradyrhizobium elkanii]MCP1989703.1 hypothetical protein [Bradyrhizobium sp. USDA 4539]
MRVALRVCLPVALALTLPLVVLWSADADAAKAHHRRGRQHLIIRPSEQVVSPDRYVYPGFGPIPPGENRNLDPSTRGSG